MLRPACPAFSFLVVAAYCAFQDFVLNRGEGGEKWKEKFREDGPGPGTLSPSLARGRSLSTRGTA